MSACMHACQSTFVHNTLKALRHSRVMLSYAASGSYIVEALGNFDKQQNCYAHRALPRSCECQQQCTAAQNEHTMAGTTCRWCTDWTARRTVSKMWRLRMVFQRSSSSRGRGGFFQGSCQAHGVLIGCPAAAPAIPSSVTVCRCPSSLLPAPGAGRSTFVSVRHSTKLVVLAVRVRQPVLFSIISCIHSCHSPCCVLLRARRPR